MYDGKTIVNVMDEMANMALMENINPNTKEGRLALIGRFITIFRDEASYIDGMELFFENKAFKAQYIETEVLKISEREDRIHAVWIRFLLKYTLAPDEDRAIAIICFYIPILVDCWDNKI